MKPIAVLLASLLALPCATRADTFGSGANTFTIDFVTIGNAGNGDDRPLDFNNNTPGNPNDDEYASPYGGVAYTYRMGVTEVADEWVGKAINLGMASVGFRGYSGLLPATSMSWYHAAVFVNWLNTSTGRQAPYALTLNPQNQTWSMTLWSSAHAWQAGGENLFRHKDAYYFLPNDDEWYKAAFHKNDGVTANYWDYATGSNSFPDGIDFQGDTTFQAVVYQGYRNLDPNIVTNVGVASPYGTRGQNGNVWEWIESAFDGLNNSPSEDRAVRGSDHIADPTIQGDFANSSQRWSSFATNEVLNYGFRVASIPEPGSAALLAAAAFPLLLRRRGRFGD